MGVWMHGCIVYGYMGVWVYGCMGSWVSAYIVTASPYFSTCVLGLKTAARCVLYAHTTPIHRYRDGSSVAVCIQVSGKDNRDLVDKNTAQKLSQEDINKMKASGASGQDIIAKLVQSSTTFSQKTAYSQQKYLKKKQRKYITRFRLCQVQAHTHTHTHTHIHTHTHTHIPQNNTHIRTHTHMHTPRRLPCHWPTLCSQQNPLQSGERY